MPFGLHHRTLEARSGADRAPRRDLCCAECGYDLHGLPMPRGAFRCPECGTEADLDTLAALIVVRRRNDRRVYNAVMFTLLALGAATLIAGHNGPAVLEATLRRLFIIATPLGFAVVAYIALITFVFIGMYWESLPRRRRAALAIAIPTVLALIPMPVGLLALLVVVNGFVVWQRME